MVLPLMRTTFLLIYDVLIKSLGSCNRGEAFPLNFTTGAGRKTMLLCAGNYTTTGPRALARRRRLKICYHR
jgi:hypothetical protein